MITETKRVNCLLRVSSRQQLHDDDIPIQRAECQRFITQHSNWLFQSEYLEKAISGFKNASKDRDILMEIAQDAKDQKFDILLVYMSDRLGRREDDTPFYVSQLNTLGIEVWSVNEGQLKTEQHIDKLMNYIRFWQANGESLKTSQRVKDAQIEMVRQGKSVGGYAPYGYEHVPSGEISNHGRALKKLIIKESEAKTVKKIYDLAYYNEFGSYKIAKRLNKEGISAIKTVEWKSSTISDILKNPIYMGYITYNRRSHKNGYKKLDRKDWIYSEEKNQSLVIISQEIWERVQELRELRKENQKMQKEQNGGSYPVSTSGQLALMGFSYCGYCGTKLTNGSRYDYWTKKDGTKVKNMAGRYKCTQKAAGSLLCSGREVYKQEEVEPIVFDIIKAYLSQFQQESIYDEVLAIKEKQRKLIELSLKSLKKEIDAIQLDILTLESQIPAAFRGESIVPLERIYSIIKEKEKNIQRMHNNYEQKLEEYRQIINMDDDTVVASLEIDWEERFTQAPIALKKVILSKLIERIDIQRDTMEIKFKVWIETLLPRKSSSSEVPEQRV